ncbi:hypothetical protein NCS52_00836700 [Fusarium sp. LHS14.1]|nr:hypothetical protein NCS52_00836700 [Fusarium sp. LHS14.1]
MSDCYCAVCSGALNDNVAIGSRQPAALRRRREEVRRRREGLSSDYDSDEPSDDEPEVWHDVDEYQSYDPDLVI